MHAQISKTSNHKMGLIKNHESGFFEDINTDAQQHRHHHYDQRHYQSNGRNHHQLRESALDKMSSSTNRHVKSRRGGDGTSGNGGHSSTSYEHSSKMSASYNHGHHNNHYNHHRDANYTKHGDGHSIIALSDDDDDSDGDHGNGNGREYGATDNGDEVDHHTEYSRYADQHSDTTETIEIADDSECNSSNEDNHNAKKTAIEDISDDDVEVIDDLPSPPTTRGDDNKRSQKSSNEPKLTRKQLLEIEEASTIRPQGTCFYLFYLVLLPFGTCLDKRDSFFWNSSTRKDKKDLWKNISFQIYETMKQYHSYKL